MSIPASTRIPSSILRLSDLKTRHAMLLMNVLRKRGSLSRVELATLMRCDNTTVTRAVRDLQSRGLLTTIGKSDRGSGRPRELLTINPEGGYVIGIALSPNNIVGAVTDLNGHFRVREQVLFSQERTRAFFLDSLIQVSKRLMAAAGKRLLGMGVSTFGTSLNGGMRLNITANFPELRQFDLSDFFQTHFHCVPEFADMMVCLMQYELSSHPEQAQGCTMLVSAGSGIGMAIAMNGQLTSGNQRHGGELGHNICDPKGLPCKCGRRGCLETVCSTDVLLKQARDATAKNDLSWDTLASDCIAGKPYARNIAAHAIPMLATALANQINNLSPNQVIITGELPQLGEWFCQELEQAIRKLLFQFTEQGLKIQFRMHQNDDGVLGAAFLAIDRIFTSQEYFEQSCPIRE